MHLYSFGKLHQRNPIIKSMITTTPLSFYMFSINAKEEPRFWKCVVQIPDMAFFIVLSTTGWIQGYIKNVTTASYTHGTNSQF
jgi:hypothetical protein